MRSEITDIIVNEKPTRLSKFRKIISAISNPDILAEKGGYLFMVLIDGSCCNLGIQPYQINGERQYHYNMLMPENEFLLTGFINVNCSLTILFKVTPEKYKAGLSAYEKASFREVFIRFARLLLENNFPEDFEIDIVTRSLLLRAGIVNTEPSTVKELGELEI
ncbi:MAG: hypothetical protein PF692_02575 [Kiritimatiellae bacterium]|jgi:hypothetical protein|nr:hypothetical protein [Kiritimatiellia bacterium]